MSTFLGLTPFIQHNGFEIYLYHHMYQYFIFNCQIITSVCLCQCVYTLSCQWYVAWFQFLARAQLTPAPRCGNFRVSSCLRKPCPLEFAKSSSSPLSPRVP